MPLDSVSANSPECTGASDTREQETKRVPYNDCPICLPRVDSALLIDAKTGQIKVLHNNAMAVSATLLRFI